MHGTGLALCLIEVKNEVKNIFAEFNFC